MNSTNYLNRYGIHWDYLYPNFEIFMEKVNEFGGEVDDNTTHRKLFTLLRGQFVNRVFKWKYEDTIYSRTALKWNDVVYTYESIQALKKYTPDQLAQQLEERKLYTVARNQDTNGTFEYEQFLDSVGTNHKSDTNTLNIIQQRTEIVKNSQQAVIKEFKPLFLPNISGYRKTEREIYGK